MRPKIVALGMAASKNLTIRISAGAENISTILTPCSARESSLPAGPIPRLQNPQPMSELRNHPRKLTPNSATFTRTGQQLLSRPVEDCERCSALAGVRNLGLDDPGPGRPDSHCNFGGVGARRVVQVPMEKPASTASRRSSLSINALRSTAKVS